MSPDHCWAIENNDVKRLREFPMRWVIMARDHCSGRENNEANRQMRLFPPRWVIMAFDQWSEMVYEIVSLILHIDHKTLNWMSLGLCAWQHVLMSSHENMLSCAHAVSGSRLRIEKVDTFSIRRRLPEMWPSTPDISPWSRTSPRSCLQSKRPRDILFPRVRSALDTSKAKTY